MIFYILLVFSAENPHIATTVPKNIYFSVMRYLSNGNKTFFSFESSIHFFVTQGMEFLCSLAIFVFKQSITLNFYVQVEFVTRMFMCSANF